jgi:hypothetical protein
VNTAELIVELVLTGLVLLAALLMPAVAGGALPIQLDDGTIAVAIAAGFLLGVVADRCADTILSRWEGLDRCRFAWRGEVPAQRRALVGTEDAKDPFPENWMRIQVMTEGSEGVRHLLEQLRIRIRIARALTVLAPALATSAALAAASLPHGPGPSPALGTGMIAVPVLHLTFLGVAVLAATWLRPPRTTRSAALDTDRRARRRLRICSAPAVWFGLQAALGRAIVVRSPDTRKVALAIVLTGALLTILAWWAWSRILVTFMQSLWNYCRFRHDVGLRRACLEDDSPRRAAADRVPSSQTAR